MPQRVGHETGGGDTGDKQVKYVGIGLLVMGLAACDDKDTNAT
ncbi:hypothetical protein ACUOFC_63120, partial [Escherichia sp. TWPC-MK]